MTAEKHHFSIEREQRFGLLYAYNGIDKTSENAIPLIY